MTTPVRFAIRPAGGRQVIGVVHGNGGVLGSDPAHAAEDLRRLRVAVTRATLGDPLVGLFEPKPGHVRVYPSYSALGDGPAVDVSLVDAEVEIAKSAPQQGRLF